MTAKSVLQYVFLIPAWVGMFVLFAFYCFNEYLAMRYLGGPVYLLAPWSYLVAAWGFITAPLTWVVLVPSAFCLLVASALDE